MSDFQERTILIVDDNPANLSVMTDFLAEYGFTILIARDGESGLEKAHYGRPDLILLDVMLPGIDGFETCRRLKADETTQEIPVIFVAAGANLPEKIKGFELGAVDYIIKPLYQEEVFARVTTHLRLRDLTRELQIELAERKQAEERFRIAVEAAPNAMVMVDETGKIVLVNSQAEVLFGYLREELIDHPVELLVPERYRHGHPLDRNSFFDNPHARPMGAGRDLYGRRKNGQEVAIEIGLNPLLTVEGPFVLASIIDITERKRVEEQIKASLLEKEILLKEIHHRVKNNLQLVSSLLQLQSGYIHDSEALVLFRESETRIRSIAMIHEKLYQSTSLGKVDFADYVGSLATMLFQIYSIPSSSITLQIDIVPMPIDIDMAVPIGLILNELLTNTLKYAFPAGREGVVTITMTLGLAGQFKLIVADDGVGFSDKVAMENPSSLGLRLVKILTRQLDAVLDFQTGSGGTKFTFTFLGTK